jgi:AAA15 family ATPase/GTPase
MIQQVRIKNFKSIPDLSFNLGRVNVLIGANGSGKSNILEALAFASAASQDKLDNEFLTSRGIRVAENRFMHPAFSHLPKPRKTSRKPSGHIHVTVDKLGKESDATTRKVAKADEQIEINVTHNDGLTFNCEIYPDTTVSFPKWRQSNPMPAELFLAQMDELRELAKSSKNIETIANALTSIGENYRSKTAGTLPNFLVYAPEDSALRTFQAEGQILPLGINGGGLFAHLKGLESIKKGQPLKKIKESLKLIDWFETFVIAENLNPNERTIKIQDRYLTAGALFDQRSANEGFLFLLFYLTLLISPETPPFFSIDNVDNSLNPKLCVALMQQITELAKEFGKQIILTTHNPAVLDGLNLHDEEQRLFVVARNQDGYTRLRRVDPPNLSPGRPPVLLSEAFMRGYIGGLPKNF